MVSRPDVSAFVLDLYEALLNPRKWTALAESFAAMVGAESASLGNNNLVNGHHKVFSRSATFSDASLNAYREHYYKMDIVSARARTFNFGKSAFRHEMVSDRELEDGEFYQDFLKPEGIFHTVGATFHTGVDEAGVMTAHRASSSRPFDDSAKYVVDELIGHCQRAIQMYKRLNAADIEWHCAALSQERFGTNIALVDRAGRILFATHMADQFLRRSPEVTAVSGRLIATDAAINARLQKAVQTAVDTTTGIVRQPERVIGIPRERGRALAVAVIPFVSRMEKATVSESAALVLIRDPDAVTPASEALRELFGLTATEAAIAAAIVDGKTLRQISADSGTSFHTVRSHVKSITQKTRTGGQSDLIALILESTLGVVQGRKLSS